jgi:glutamate racemase
VLGSTHYVFLKPLIAAVAGPQVTLIDTGEAVARQLARVLGERGLAAPEDSAPGEKFWTSGDLRVAERVMSLLLRRPVTVEKLPV